MKYQRIQPFPAPNTYEFPELRDFTNRLHEAFNKGSTAEEAERRRQAEKF